LKLPKRVFSVRFGARYSQLRGFNEDWRSNYDPRLLSR
jgi:hypothetical protein